MNNFLSDDRYSKKMDVVLSDYWKGLAFEGRYIFTNSEMLQKTLGIDVIIQVENNDREITVDTKHVRGDWKRLFLEAMSCTVEQFGLKEGWGIKQEGRPDYIMHVMHGYCKGCLGDCAKCDYKIEHISNAYITPAKNILDWYRQKYTTGILKKSKEYGYHKMIDKNRTDGHNIPIGTMIRELGTKVCNLKIGDIRR